MDLEQKEKIAVFRFGVIFPLVECNVQENWGEKAKILKEQVSKEWTIPCSNRNYIGKATILNWLKRYEEGGRKIEALYPAGREDRGQTRSLDDESRDALVRLRLEKPKLSVPRLVEIARDKDILPKNQNVSMATIYRILKPYKTDNKQSTKEDMRKFEVQMPNDLWQSDCMHGPKVQHEGKERKTYLFAIIDDHSRLITHAYFYLCETLQSFLDCLWSAMRKRGVPRRIYVDNGPSFRSHQLQLGCASLEIVLAYARPYRPQGKGKIERFFRTVRSQFLPELPEILTLEELNRRFIQYLETYQNRIHGSTGQEPIKRYLANAGFLRPAPDNLPLHFRKKAIRRVNNDRTVKLEGKLFEAPLGLAGLSVMLRYENHERIEVFLDEQSKGFLTPLHKQGNSRISRESNQIYQKGMLFEKTAGGESWNR